MGAKHFSFAFDGGRTAPYHIIEKRGRFVGSLWLGFKSLQWLITTWRSLRKIEDLKGFFQFLRTEYTLELSCLQNHYGRFVEICEYHGRAQRGGIRIPEGFRVKNWDHFIQELYSFFPGKAAPVETHVGKSRSVKEISNLERRDTCVAPVPPISESSKGKNVLESRDTYEFKKESVGFNLPRFKLNPEAPRPTRQCDFKWTPFNKTLRITMLAGGTR